MIKEFVRQALTDIAEPGDWNTAASVRAGHMSIEQIVGDVHSPRWTYQDVDGLGVDEDRTTDADSGLVILSIRAYKKTNYATEDKAWYREREAERLLKDTTKAVLKNPSMLCRATGAQITTPTRCGSIEGAPGWVDAELTIIVGYQGSRLDP